MSAAIENLPPVADYVDSEMLDISRSFNWLTAVSPTGSDGVWDRFRASDFSEAPRFRYRDPGIDTQAVRMRLLRLPVGEIEEPVFKALLAEKQRELDRQLELIDLLDTPGFLQASIDLFGIAEPDLHDEALHILDVVPPERTTAGSWVDAQQVMEAARKQIAFYRRQCRDFTARVRRRPDITAGLMVTNDTLLVSNNVIIPHDRLDALLHHEIGTHILTWYNGGHQPLKQLQTGLAHYDELQEGLGVLAEYLSGNLSAIRLRTLAARVVAVRLVTEGARFKDIFDTLRNDYRFTERAAFTITARVLRGGGLTKDVVYLRGLKGVLGYLREGYPFRLLLAGKFSLAELPAVRSLDSMGLLAPPAMLPAYLHNAAAQRRLDECTDIPLDRLYQRLVA